MPLLSSSSRRFARTYRHSHEQRQNRIDSVRTRIELIAPTGLPGRTSPAERRR